MSSTLVRVGGVAAVIAGLLVVVQEAWGLPGGGVVQEGFAESAVHTAQLLFMVFGVIGIALAQQRKAGVFAQIAVLVAVLGCVAMFGVALTEITILPSLVEAGSPLGQTPPPAMDVAAISSFVVWIVGLMLLSAGVLVTRVLPRIPAALLGGGLILGAVLREAVPGVLVVYAIGFGWLGVAAFRMAGRNSAIVTRSTEHTSGHQQPTR